LQQGHFRVRTRVSHASRLKDQGQNPHPVPNERLGGLRGRARRGRRHDRWSRGGTGGRRGAGRGRIGGQRSRLGVRGAPGQRRSQHDRGYGQRTGCAFSRHLLDPYDDRPRRRTNQRRRQQPTSQRGAGSRAGLTSVDNRYCCALAMRSSRCWCTTSGCSSWMKWEPRSTMYSASGIRSAAVLMSCADASMSYFPATNDVGT
jgi:hypothetical protein